MRPASLLPPQILLCILSFLQFLDESSGAHGLRIPIPLRPRLEVNDLDPALSVPDVRPTIDDGPGIIRLKNDANMYYFAEVTMGDQTARNLLVDTGSADTWAERSSQSPSLGQATDTWIEVDYEDGSIQGVVRTAPIRIGDLKVDPQAFIDVTSDHNTFGSPGILGLGPSSLSTIYTTLRDSSVPGSASFPRNLFDSDSSISPYISILLSRSPRPSALTFGTIIPGLESVVSAPRMKLQAATPGVGQQWEIPLDPQGLAVDGVSIPLPRSTLPSSIDPHRLTALLDTGFSLNQVPPAVAEAIYASVPGARWDELEDIWRVPCSTEVHVSFSFGGSTYPVHPLDTVMDLDLDDDEGGNAHCAGTFQPFTTEHAHSTDIILGMPFIRSVYLKLYYGSLLAHAPQGTEEPYIQMLSTAPTTQQMHEEFIAARPGGDLDAVAIENWDAVVGLHTSSPSEIWTWRQKMLRNVGVAVFMAVTSGLSWLL